MDELIETRNSPVQYANHGNTQKAKKHDIVLWEVYDAEVYKLVEKTKNPEFWGSKEVYTSPLSTEMLGIINQLGREDYFISDGYSSQDKSTTL